MDWIDDAARPLLGLVTKDLLDARLTPAQRRALVRSGWLIAVHPGVYRLAGAPVTWEQEQLAGQLYLGARGVSAARSAARLWRMESVPAERHEFVAETRHTSRRRGLVVHSSTLLPAGHIVTLGPHRLTSPARTLVDLSATLWPDRYGTVLDKAARDGLATFDDVERVRMELRARGRRRTTVVDEVLADRLGTAGPGDSELVARAVRWIRAAGMPQPQTEVWVVVRGDRYRLDVAWPLAKVAVECDGWRDHRMRTRFSSDRRKVTELHLGGWLVVIITADTPRAVFIRQVADALAARRPAA